MKMIATTRLISDKPTLAESMIVWKLTALAFGISTDGGKLTHMDLPLMEN